MSFFRQISAWLFSERGHSLGLLILRLIGGVFIMTHGVAKIENFTQLSQNFADPIGLGPKLSLVLIIFAEVGCSILLILGAFTRLAAIPLIIGMAVAAFIAHKPFAFSDSELPLIYMFIAATLFFTGAGRYSLDYLMGRNLLKSTR